MPKATFFNLPEEKRRSIERLAIEEFAENNYHQASISRLVDRAGIAKGSFYQYFEDKEELFQYLLGMAADQKAKFLEQALAADTEGTIYDQLRRLMRRGLEFEFSHPGLAQIAYRAYYGEAPLAEEVMEALRRGGRQFFRSLVERGQDEGSIDERLDPELLGWLFSVVFNNLGEYLIDEMEINPADLQAQGIRALDRAAYDPLVDEIIKLLERTTAVQGERDVD